MFDSLAMSTKVAREIEFRLANPAKVIAFRAVPTGAKGGDDK